LFPDFLRRLLRHDAEFGERIGRMRLDLEPDAELGLGRPDGGHLGSGIARDHAFGLYLWGALLVADGRGRLNVLKPSRHRDPVVIRPFEADTADRDHDDENWIPALRERGLDAADAVGKRTMAALRYRGIFVKHARLGLCNRADARRAETLCITPSHAL